MQKYLLLTFLIVFSIGNVFSKTIKIKLSELDRAVLTNDVRKVKEVTKRRPKLINPKKTRNGFPLYYAVYMDNTDIASHLIKKGAKINKALPNGITPLFLAVTRNQIAMTELLVRNKAKINIAINGITPLQMAIDFRYFALQTYLEKKGAKKVLKTRAKSKTKKRKTSNRKKVIRRRRRKKP